jgi:hypothetical protein
MGLVGTTALLFSAIKILPALLLGKLAGDITTASGFDPYTSITAGIGVFLLAVIFFHHKFKWKNPGAIIKTMAIIFVISCGCNIYFHNRSSLVKYPLKTQWFSPIDGKPKLFFEKTENEIFIFNRAGYNPNTGTQLHPVSAELRTEYETNEMWRHPKIITITNTITFYHTNYGMVFIQSTNYVVENITHTNYVKQLMLIPATNYVVKTITRRPIIVKDQPFPLPNPEELYWANGTELSAFIGGDKSECLGYYDESKEHWFLTRVDLVAFNVRTNNDHVVITRRHHSQ